jgi:hypothetical protein
MKETFEVGKAIEGVENAYRVAFLVIATALHAKDVLHFSDLANLIEKTSKTQNPLSKEILSQLISELRKLAHQENEPWA